MALLFNNAEFRIKRIIKDKQEVTRNLWKSWWSSRWGKLGEGRVFEIAKKNKRRVEFSENGFEKKTQNGK